MEEKPGLDGHDLEESKDSIYVGEFGWNFYERAKECFCPEEDRLPHPQTLEESPPW